MFWFLCRVLMIDGVTFESQCLCCSDGLGLALSERCNGGLRKHVRICEVGPLVIRGLRIRIILSLIEGAAHCFNHLHRFVAGFSQVS